MAVPRIYFWRRQASCASNWTRNAIRPQLHYLRIAPSESLNHSKSIIKFKYKPIKIANMKAATSSLAFAALVAFGGLVCPCFTSDNGYLELSNYLDDPVNGETLSDKILSMRNLIYSQATKFAERSPEFKFLALAFIDLNDGDNDKFCYSDALVSLRYLVEAAVNCDITPPNSHTSVKKLNDLLVEQKNMVRARCYEHIKSKWDDMKSNDIYEYVRQDKLFMSINLMVRAQHDLLQSLIYRPKNAPDSAIAADKSRIEDILFRSILEADQRFRHEEIPFFEFIYYTELVFVDKCRNIIHYSISGPTTEPLKELLALEMMNLPGDQNLAEAEMPYSLIPPLPIYLICKWFMYKRRPVRSDMISSLHKRLSEYRSAQGRRFFI